jgi:O-antigen/teichoic acid export membrane protein
VSLPELDRTASEATMDISSMALLASAKAGIASGPEPLASAAKSVPPMAILRARLRAWGWLSALSFVDQGLTSAAGFGVNLFLARMPPKVYGAFAVAFAGFLFVAGFHNVLLLEPMSVMGPSRYAEKLPAYFRSMIVVHAVLVGALSGVLLLAGLILQAVAPQSPLVSAVMGGALAIPFLLLAWLARRMCYVTQRPELAVQGSALYLGLVGGGIFLLMHFASLNSFSAFVLMGLAGLASAGLLVQRLGLFQENPGVRTSVPWNLILRENWAYGKWLIGSALLNPAVSQAQFFIIAAFLGLSSAAVLRAMQLPSLLMTQVITATGLLFLPVFSGDFGRRARDRMRQKAMLLSLVLAGAALGFAAFLALFSKQLEQMLFTGKYAAYAWLMPVLALLPVVSAFSVGYCMALRASQKPQFDLLANLVAAPVALLSALCFIRWWGYPGAAASLVLAFLVYGAVTISCFFKAA